MKRRGDGIAWARGLPAPVDGRALFEVRASGLSRIVGIRQQCVGLALALHRCGQIGVFATAQQAARGADGQRWVGCDFVSQG